MNTTQDTTTTYGPSTRNVLSLEAQHIALWAADLAEATRTGDAYKAVQLASLIQDSAQRVLDANTIEVAR